MITAFLISAAVVLVCAGLAVKIKKQRVLLGILAALALVPAALFGLIAFGGGAIVNYPGDPAGAVEGMTDALSDLDFETADGYVIGSLGLETADAEGETARLQDLMEKLLLSDKTDSWVEV